MPVTNYVYDGDNVLMETDQNNVPTVVYTHEPGPYGALISQNRGGVTSYVHYDGQGNVRQLTDESGTVTDTFDFNAFGEQIHRTGTTVIPFRWNGKSGYYWDEELSRYHVRARPYEPASGRWTTQDPLLFVDGPNLYWYVSNNPTNFFDPSGTEGEAIFDPTNIPPVIAGPGYGCAACHPVQISPAKKCPKWTNGGDWNFKNSSISNLATWGETHATNAGSIYTLILDAGWWARFDFTTTGVLQGTICCCSSLGKERYVKVNIEATVTFNVVAKIGRKLTKGISSGISYIYGWKWGVGYIAGNTTVSIASAAISIQEKIAALNDATADLTKQYRVIDSKNVQVELSPALICASKVTDLTIVASGLTAPPIFIGNRQPNPVHGPVTGPLAGPFPVD